MNNAAVAKAVWKFAKSHANLILAAVSIVGLVATSVEASKATVKVHEKLKDISAEKGEKLTVEETIKACWKDYIPTAVIGGVTISCIIASGIISVNDQKKLAGAYAMLDQGYKAYRKKISEKYGTEVDKEIAQEVVDEVIVEETDDDEYEGKKILFYVPYTDRYFDASKLKVQEGIYYVNRSLSMTGYASVNDLYRGIGLPETEEGNFLGWDIEELSEWIGLFWLDFDISKTMLDENTYCYVLEAIYPPCEDYIK